MAVDWAILERAPEVLARFVADSQFLQQTAAEAGALKIVFKLLRDSYEPLPVQTLKPWSPTPDRGVSEPAEGFSTSQIRPPGRLPVYAHRIKMRESALKLIAAMVTFKDEYRKALTAADADVMPYIVESLYSLPSKPSKEKPKLGNGFDDAEPQNPTAAYGNNPNSVIIAACHVVRNLGRSVSNLRTALVDYGVAAPVVKLLRHPNPDVQIAASGVVCNLVTDCCPMREVCSYLYPVPVSLPSMLVMC
jgi:hypothetical protein